MRILFLVMAAAALAGLAWFLASEPPGADVTDLGGPVARSGADFSGVDAGLDTLDPAGGNGRTLASPTAAAAETTQTTGAIQGDEHPWDGQLPGVVGRVVEADGQPAAGLPISLLEFSFDTVFPEDMVAMPHESLVAGTTVTGADGRFRVDGGLGTGVHGLGIDMGGARSTVRFIDESLTYGVNTDVGDIVLPVHGIVFGLVIDEDGEPVEGARVRFAVLPDLLAQAGAFDIRAGAVLASPEGTGAAVHPIPGWASSMIDRLPVSTGWTNGEGEFRIEGVPAGRVVGGADHERFTVALADPFELTPGAEHDVGELELLVGRTAQGRVVDGAGQPVAEALMIAGTMKPMIEVGFLHPAPVSDEDGQFTIGGLPEIGDVVVAARRSSRDPWVAILTPRAPRGLVITLPTAPDATIELVDDATGEPIIGAQLELRPRTKTDRFSIVGRLAQFNRGAVEPGVVREEGEGQYVVEALPVGEWSLVASVPSHAPLEVDFSHTSPPLLQALRMVRGRHIPFVVVDASTREPVAAAHVALMSAEPDQFQAIASGWTDPEGQIALGPLSTKGALSRARGASFLMGGVSVVIQHPSYGRNVIPFMMPPVAAEVALEPLELALLPTVELNGRVTWGGESPKLRYMALLELDGTDTGELPRFALTSEDGHFVFRGLVAGSYRLDLTERFLNVDPLGFLAGESQARPMNGPAIIIDGKEPASVEFNLSANGEEQPGWVVGSVQLHGQPLAGAKVKIGYDSKAELFTDGSGRFRSGELAPAYHMVAIEIPGQEALDGNGEADWEKVYSNSIRVHGGGEARLDLVLEDSELQVLVVDAVTGAPLDKAEIAKNGQAMATTGPAGLATMTMRIPMLAQVPAFGSFTQTVDSVSVTRAGYDIEWITVDAQTAADSQVHPMEVRLQPSIPCSGTVILPAGFDLEGSVRYLMLECETEDNGTFYDYVEIDPETLTFQKEGLVSGDYSVRLSQDSGPGLKTQFVLPEGGATDLVIDFSQ